MVSLFPLPPSAPRLAPFSVALSPPTPAAPSPPHPLLQRSPFTPPPACKRPGQKRRLVTRQKFRPCSVPRFHLGLLPFFLFFFSPLIISSCGQVGQRPPARDAGTGGRGEPAAKPSAPLFRFFLVFSHPPSPLLSSFPFLALRLCPPAAALFQVVGIMRNNMERVLERDAKLADLEDTSGACVPTRVPADAVRLPVCVRVRACVCVRACV